MGRGMSVNFPNSGRELISWCLLAIVDDTLYQLLLSISDGCVGRGCDACDPDPDLHPTPTFLAHDQPPSLSTNDSTYIITVHITITSSLEGHIK